jgi:signal transduction histidine kinase
VASIALAIGSNQYYKSVSERIRQSSVDEIKDNAKATGHVVSLTIKNKLESITSSLEILSGSPAMNSKWLDRGQVLLASAEAASDSLTDEYIWADENGVVLKGASTSRGNLDAEGIEGADISSADYFKIPKETNKPYIAGFTKGSDGISRIYTSYPIVGAAGAFTDELDPSAAAIQKDSSFKGVVVASIKLNSLSSIAAESATSGVLVVSRILDKDGVVLMSQGSPEYVGRSWFGKEVQSSYFPRIIPIEQEQAVNQFSQTALSSKVPSSIDFTRSGVPSTLLANPIILQDSHVMTLFTGVSHDIPATTLAIIDEQRIISTTLIVAIIAGAAFASFGFLSWNRNLRRLVSKRTLELEAKTEVLDKANEKLLNHDRLQREFINIAAHELRTPIQPLLGIADVLNAQFSGGKEKIEVSRAEVDMIIRNAQRLEKLSSDILEASRIEGKDLKLNKEVFDLNEKIRQVVEDIRPFIESNRKITIDYSPLPEREAAVMVEADKSRIFQVVSNLLRNAIKFTPEGTIKISLTKRDNMEEVSVKDSGIGIDSEIMPKMFERFTSKSEQGTGLGLFISKSIVTAHGGKIWGENNVDGRGATFYFTLPALPEAVKKV